MHLTIAYWDWLFWCILIMFATLSYSHSIAQNKLYNDKIMNHSFNFQSMQSSLLSGWGTLLNHWDILPVGVMLDDCHNVSYICTGHICTAYQNSRYYLSEQVSSFWSAHCKWNKHGGNENFIALSNNHKSFVINIFNSIWINKKKKPRASRV